MNLWCQQRSRSRSPTPQRFSRSLSEGHSHSNSVNESRASNYYGSEPRYANQVQIFRDQGRTVCTISLQGSASEDDVPKTPLQAYRLPLIHGKRTRRNLRGKPEDIATTTQGAPYSSSDLIGSYSNESPSNNRLSSNDDLRHGNGSQSDRHDRRVVANRSRKDSGEGGRPSSRKQSKNGMNVSSGKASQDREREKDREQDARDRHKEIEGGGGGGGGGASTTVLPPANAKTQHTNYSSFRPMNARNNFLGGQQINPLPSQKTQQSSNTSSSNSRESDDMVAMGTNPLTSRFRTRESSFVNGGGVYLTQSSSNTAAMARKFPKTNGFTPTRVRDSDPKYADPLSGAPPSFQQRLAEITSLEQETIRYERTKKFKKKKET